jgi:cell fate regulator YaaT (PSP1 superfamily)
MPTVVGIRFKDSGKTYHFDPQNMVFAKGEWVIVETVRGPELGRVATPIEDIPQNQFFGELKPVLRSAMQQDFDQLHHLQQYEEEALSICTEKVAEHKLAMNLIKAEYNFDGSRLTFYFTADRRVDFRALVRDLARTFRTRIELRQIGPRDEAKLLGGVGPCGRLLCCATFLPDFARVSIKMAKDQDLPLNPTKISGVCGRLLCCLSYEHEQYLDIKAELPKVGDWVRTPDGPGDVVAVNVVKETVTVELTNGNTTECTAAQILEVTQRVAAEAQARNAEGITPVSHRYGVHHALEHNELLLSDDPSLLEALEDLDEDAASTANSSRQPRVRPEVALAESLTRRRSTPSVTQSQEQATASNGEVGVSEQEAPAAASGSRNQRRRKRRAVTRQVEEVVQAGATQSASKTDENGEELVPKEAGRKRRRHRGRGKI